MSFGQVMALLIIVAAVAIVLWPKSDFVIRVRGGRVSTRGRLPTAQRAAIAEFFLSDLREVERVTVRGRREASGRWRLRFSGSVAPGDQQRIRNFLLTVL